MVEDCFEDIDFITFPYLLGNVVDKESEPAPHSLIDFYDELLPEDIRQEYDSLRKSIKSDLTLFKQLSKVLDVISHGVQYRGWHKLFWNGSKPKNEMEVHITLDLLFDAYFGEAKVDVSREADIGTGKIDFKFYSNSNEQVPIEVKLGESSRIKHGFEKQLVHYMNATGCTNAYYVIVCFTNDELTKAKELAKGLRPPKDKVIEIVILDVTLKKSASRL
jgi:CRISPR/Cas system-associated exonuclease Cas4 (RecB family)